MILGQGSIYGKMDLIIGKLMITSQRQGRSVRVPVMELVMVLVTF